MVDHKVDGARGLGECGVHEVRGQERAEDLTGLVATLTFEILRGDLPRPLDGRTIVWKVARRHGTHDPRAARPANRDFCHRSQAARLYCWVTYGVGGSRTATGREP